MFCAVRRPPWHRTGKARSLRTTFVVVIGSRSPSAASLAPIRQCVHERQVPTLARTDDCPCVVALLIGTHVRYSGFASRLEQACITRKRRHGSSLPFSKRDSSAAHNSPESSIRAPRCMPKVVFVVVWHMVLAYARTHPIGAGQTSSAPSAAHERQALCQATRFGPRVVNHRLRNGRRAKHERPGALAAGPLRHAAEPPRSHLAR